MEVKRGGETGRKGERDKEGGEGGEIRREGEGQKWGRETRGEGERLQMITCDCGCLLVIPRLHASILIFDDCYYYPQPQC